MTNRTMNSSSQTFTIRVDNYVTDDTFDVCHTFLAVAEDIAIKMVVDSVDPEIFDDEAFASCTVWSPEGKRINGFQIHPNLRDDGRVTASVL